MNLSAWIPEEAPELSPQAYAMQQALALRDLDADAMAAELCRTLGDDRVSEALRPLAGHLDGTAWDADPLEVVEELLARVPEIRVRLLLTPLAEAYGAARLAERQE